MDIDIEKKYTTHELLDYYYENKKNSSYENHNNSLELGITIYDEKYNKTKYYKYQYFKKITSSILYTLGLGLYIYQIFNYQNKINYITKDKFGILYGYFLIIYPIIFTLSIMFMSVPQKKRKLLYLYDIAIASIIISSLLILPKVNNFYGKYLVIPLITLLGSIPFIIVYICIPILKILYWLL